MPARSQWTVEQARAWYARQPWRVAWERSGPPISHLEVAPREDALDSNPYDRPALEGQLGILRVSVP